MVTGVSFFRSLSWMEAPCSSKGWMQSVLPMAATTCRGVLPRGDLARQFAPVRLKRPTGVVRSPSQESLHVTLRHSEKGSRDMAGIQQRVDAALGDMVASFSSSLFPSNLVSGDTRETAHSSLLFQTSCILLPAGHPLMDLSAHLPTYAHCNTVSIPSLSFLLIALASKAPVSCIP